ncbi:substrate-binding domain-containing protein [Streptomyces hirsutus]
MDPHGSTAGIRELVAGREAKEGSPPMVALSDGPKPDGLPELRENPVAVSLSPWS